MNRGKIIVVSAIVISFLSVPIIYNIFKTQTTQNKSETTNEKTNTTDKKARLTKNSSVSGKTKSGKITIKQADLYNSLPPSAVPFSAINELADLPQNTKNEINKMIEKDGIYMLKRTKDKVFVISKNSDDIRQGIEFVEFSLTDNHKKISVPGYDKKNRSSEHDQWEVNENQMPLKHTAYDSKGNIEFTEQWNYDPNNPIKYELKDAEGKTISIRKEIFDNNTEMRVEHLIYNNNGDTKISITTSYDGADLKRFTYYNADSADKGTSVFAEYHDGFKTKETVYNSDLKIENTYEAEYTDGTLSNINVFDNKNNKTISIKSSD